MISKLVLLWEQDVIDNFWKIQQGTPGIVTLQPTAAATALGEPPEERWTNKEKRKESVNRLFISVCELASNTISATRVLETYLKRKLSFRYSYINEQSHTLFALSPFQAQELLVFVRPRFPLQPERK
jgi:hypothetical protein